MSYQIYDPETSAPHFQFKNDGLGEIRIGNSVRFEFESVTLPENIVEYYIHIKTEGKVKFDTEVFQVDTEIFCPDISEFIEAVGEQDPTVQWTNTGEAVFSLTIDYISTDPTSTCDIT